MSLPLPSNSAAYGQPSMPATNPQVVAPTPVATDHRSDRPATLAELARLGEAMPRLPTCARIGLGVALCAPLATKNRVPQIDPTLCLGAGASRPPAIRPGTRPRCERQPMRTFGILCPAIRPNALVALPTTRRLSAARLGRPLSHAFNHQCPNL